MPDRCHRCQRSESRGQCRQPRAASRETRRAGPAREIPACRAHESPPASNSPDSRRSQSSRGCRSGRCGLPGSVPLRSPFEPMCRGGIVVQMIHRRCPYAHRTESALARDGPLVARRIGGYRMIASNDTPRCLDAADRRRNPRCCERSREVERVDDIAGVDHAVDRRHPLPVAGCSCDRGPMTGECVGPTWPDGRSPTSRTGCPEWPDRSPSSMAVVPQMTECRDAAEEAIAGRVPPGEASF